MTPLAGSTEPVAILLIQGDRGESDTVESPGGATRADDLTAANLSEQLLADGFGVRVAHTPTHARALARGSPTDLVLIRAGRSLRAALDLVVEIRGGEWLGAPDIGGARGECRAPPVRCRPHRWPARVPIVVIVPRSSRIDLLRVFEAGADDCLTAPLFYLELRARMRALIERCRCDVASQVVRAGPLAIDTASRTVTLDGRRTLMLPRLQFELLLALARDPQRVIARSELTRRLWGLEPPDSTRSLDSHASRLRRLLQTADAERWIVSVRGVGYRLR